MNISYIEIKLKNNNILKIKSMHPALEICSVFNTIVYNIDCIEHPDIDEFSLQNRSLSTLKSDRLIFIPYDGMLIKLDNSIWDVDKRIALQFNGINSIQLYKDIVNIKLKNIKQKLNLQDFLAMSYMTYTTEVSNIGERITTVMRTSKFEVVISRDKLNYTTRIIFRVLQGQ